MLKNINRGKYGRYIQEILTLSDFIILNVVFLCVALLIPEVVEHRSRLIWLLLNVAFIPVAYWLGGIHRARAIPMHHVLFNSLRVVGLHALMFISLLFFLETDTFQWQSLAVFYSLLFVVFPVWWSASRMTLKFLRRRGYNYSKIVIVGTGTTANRLYEEMRKDPGFGYKIHGFFDNKIEPDFRRRDLYRGTLDMLDSYISANHIDEVFYTLSGNDEAALSTALHAADANVVKFYYVPQISRYLARGFNLRAVGSMPIMSVRETPLSSLPNAVLKRTFDIIFSTIVLLLLFPIVFIPVAIAIKLSSPGPVLFRQKRTGYLGRDFLCLKFRTMRINDDDNSKQTSRDDPRKTRVGDFLRRTSIDELPQFINVLLGDMSVVGPRPHMLRDTQDYSALIDKYMVRHFIKPGITGWAQVNGYRGATDELWKMEQRVEHDVWYSENWSFLLDIKIIVRTVINAVQGEKNAF